MTAVSLPVGLTTAAVRANTAPKDAKIAAGGGGPARPQRLPQYVRDQGIVVPRRGFNPFITDIAGVGTDFVQNILPRVVDVLSWVARAQPPRSTDLAAAFGRILVEVLVRQTRCLSVGRSGVDLPGLTTILGNSFVHVTGTHVGTSFSNVSDHAPFVPDFAIEHATSAHNASRRRRC